MRSLCRRCLGNGEITEQHRCLRCIELWSQDSRCSEAPNQELRKGRRKWWIGMPKDEARRSKLTFHFAKECSSFRSTALESVPTIIASWINDGAKWCLRYWPRFSPISFRHRQRLRVAEGEIVNRLRANSDNCMKFVYWKSARNERRSEKWAQWSFWQIFTKQCRTSFYHCWHEKLKTFYLASCDFPRKVLILNLCGNRTRSQSLITHVQQSLIRFWGEIGGKMRTEKFLSHDEVN